MWLAVFRLFYSSIHLHMHGCGSLGGERHQKRGRHANFPRRTGTMGGCLGLEITEITGFSIGFFGSARVGKHRISVKVSLYQSQVTDRAKLSKHMGQIQDLDRDLSCSDRYYIGQYKS